MNANWHTPFSPVEVADMRAISSGAHPGVADNMPPELGRFKRNRLDYQLIFAVCLAVFFWAGAAERCNPLFWSSKQAAQRKSIWREAMESAHRCSCLAFRG